METLAQILGKILWLDQVEPRVAARVKDVISEAVGHRLQQPVAILPGKVTSLEGFRRALQSSAGRQMDAGVATRLLNRMDEYFRVKDVLSDPGVSSLVAQAWEEHDALRQSTRATRSFDRIAESVIRELNARGPQLESAMAEAITETAMEVLRKKDLREATKGVPTMGTLGELCKLPRVETACEVKA